MNSVLFLLLGLEVLVLSFADVSPGLAALAIPIVLLGRLLAVSGPLLVLGWGRLMSIRNVPFLTWAGIRGGISVALALSLPESPAKSGILAATYAVVLFSIIVQGLTLERVARRTIRLTSGDDEQARAEASLTLQPPSEISLRSPPGEHRPPS